MRFYHGLKDDSIRHGFQTIARRAAVAGPFNFGLYLITILNVPAVQELWGSHLSAAILFVMMISRVILWKWGPLLLRRRAHYTYWRLAFGMNACALALVWAYTGASVFLNQGPAPVTFFIWACCFGIGTLSIASFSFDVVSNLVFQLVMFLPITAAILSAGGQGMNLAIGCGFVIFTSFVSYATLSAFRFHLEALRNAEIIERQRMTLQAVIDSIDEVFLTFNRDGYCDSVPSKKASLLLGEEPTGRHIIEILGVSEEKRADILDWYQLLMADKMDFAEAAQWGMSELHVSNGQTTLKLNYHPLRTAGGRLTGITLTAMDISAEVKARAAAQRERERAEMIVKIVENRAAFRSLLQSMSTCFECLAQWNGGDFAPLRRDLHTYRGGISSFGAQGLAAAIYALELRLHALDTSSGHSAVRELGRKLTELFGAWQAQESALLTQLGVFRGDTVEVPAERIAELLARLRTEGAKPELQHFAEQRLLQTELGEILNSFAATVQNASRQTGKDVHFHLQKSAEPVFVPRSAYEDVFRAMVHLFNNAVDHGIEPAEARLAAGKPAHGRIEVSYAMSPTGIRIQIADDGGGINVTKLREALARKGRPADGESPLETAEHIFDDGLSTSSAVTQVSGQGVGMGAVRAAIESAKGEIRIARTGPDGTCFEIRLPLLSETAPAHAAA